MFRSLCLFFIAMLLVACANQGIIKISTDTYKIIRQYKGDRFESVSELKRSVICEANAFAEDNGMAAVPAHAIEELNDQGKIATFEYHFHLAIPEDYLKLAINMNNLATSYQTSGRYDQAEVLFIQARELYLKAYGEEHQALATSINNLASLYYTMDRYRESESLFEEALKMRKKLLGVEDLDVAASMNGLAMVFYCTGRLSKAEPLFKQAFEIREKLLKDEHQDVASSMNNLALIHFAKGRYGEAEPLFKRSLAMRKKLFGSEHRDVATSMNNLALIYYYTGRYDEAERLYKQTLQIDQRLYGEKDPRVATSLDHLALLYKTVARYMEAESLFKQALAIRKNRYGNEHKDVAMSMNNLGLLCYARGLYGDAEPLFKRSLVIRKKLFGSEHREVATSMNNLALLFYNTGRYDKSERLFKQALALEKRIYGDDHVNVATTMNNLARLYKTNQRYDDAAILLKNALALDKRIYGPEHPHVATSMDNLAELYRTTGALDEAESLYQKAFEMRKRLLGSEHPHLATSMNNLAALYHKTGRIQEAQILLEKGLVIAQQAGELDLLHHIQGSLSRVLAAGNQVDAAIFFGKQAVNTIQQMRQSVASLAKETQKRFLLTKEQTYKDLAELLIDQKRFAEAIQVLAMLKEEEYHDFIRREGGTSDHTPVPYTAEEEPLRITYGKISARLAGLGYEIGKLEKKRDMVGFSDKEKEHLRFLKFKILPVARRAFYTSLKDIYTKLGQMSDKRKLAAAKSKKLEKLESLQPTLRELGHGAVLIHYLMLKNEMKILLTTPNVQIARESPIGEKKLVHKIMAFRKSVCKPGTDVLPLAKELYGYLFEPIIEDLRQAHAETIMVALDGVLRYMPMAALHDGNKYLVEEFKLVLFTEAAKDKLKDHKTTNWRVAGLGLTKAINGLNALPAVEEELDGIVREDDTDQRGVLAGRVYLDEAFTVLTLQNVLMEAYPVLHIASHFKFEPGNESLSCLILGDGTELNLVDIRNTYDFPYVDLLTLSACDTAMGSDANGQEIEGFGAMAQNKGAKGVLATLWKVADQSTAQFMETMYALRTSEALTIAGALQKTQIQFIRGVAGRQKKGAQRHRFGYSDGVESKYYNSRNGRTAPYSHPYYWAPFILMGNWL